VITSTANPRVKDVVALRKGRVRRDTGRFVVEGRREVMRCLAAGVPVEVVYLCPELGSVGDSTRPWLPSSPGEGELVDVSAAVFERMSLRQGPDGVLAVARDLPTSLERIRLVHDPLVLVVVGIEKPGNLGTMARSALAAGAHAVVLADAVTDATNPNAIRASQGAIFEVPLATATTAEAIGWLERHGVPGYAADPGAALPYWDAPLAGPAAIVIGAEHAGLPDAWRSAATPVGIPMSASVAADSLNASAAAAILLFDAVRQRQGQPQRRSRS
jgi:TrmH family RNA methyltransferase